MDERIIGRYGDGSKGGLLLVTAAIHGNEPAGVTACRYVLDLLGRRAPELRGEVVFLIGNLAAFKARTRYIDRDLNRIWFDQGEGTQGADTEGVERSELIELVNNFLAGASGQAFLIDLHTSSAAGVPFMTVGDTIRNRRFAVNFPLPRMLGLEEQIDGSLLEYMNNRGLVTLGLEAGRHDAPSSSQAMKAMLLLALVATGLMSRSELSEEGSLRRSLSRLAEGVPRALEVRYRHSIKPADGFVMKQGFVSFQPVAAGELLAEDRRGEVLSPESGYILLPLYQGQGDDGFFLARNVRKYWLTVSHILRLLRVPELLPLVPGIRKSGPAADVLEADRWVRGRLWLWILRLLGYRKVRSEGDIVVLSRRKHDLVYRRLS